MRLLSPQRRILHCQVAVHPLDAMTGQPPAGPVSGRLEVADRFGRWRDAGQHAIRTDNGVLAWPGLGLTARPDSALPGRFRVFVEAPGYRAAWRDDADRLSIDPLRFDVRPYGHDAPLAADSIPLPRAVLLFPDSTWRFAPHVPVAHGTVRRGGQGLADIQVSHGTDMVLTDDRGAFGLPLGQVEPGELVLVASTLGGDRRSQVAVRFPEDLARAVSIHLD